AAGKPAPPKPRMTIRLIQNTASNGIEALLTNSTPRSSLRCVSLSQRNPDGSRAISVLFQTGASQVGDQFQRKNAHARIITTGKTKTRMGFLQRSPTANEVIAVNTIVRKPNMIAGTW